MANILWLAPTSCSSHGVAAPAILFWNFTGSEKMETLDQDMGDRGLNPHSSMEGCEVPSGHSQAA